MTPRGTARSRSSVNQSHESSESMQMRRSRRRHGRTEEGDGGEQQLEEEDREEMGRDDENGGEVTRCICGHQELQTNHINKGRAAEIDPGLFIQCDKCQVWQHGFCVGFESEEEVPEVYFCEKCRPELHLVMLRPSGKTSRYIPHLKAKGKENSEEDAKVKPETKSKKESSRRTRDRGKERTKHSGDRSSSRAASPATNERSSRRRTLNSRDAAYEETLKRVLEESVQELKDGKDEAREDHNDSIEGESSHSGHSARYSPEKDKQENGRKRSDRDESSDDVPSAKSLRPGRSSALSRSIPTKKDLVDGTDTKTSAQDDDTSETSTKRKPNRSRAPRLHKTATQKYNNDRAKPRIPQPRSTVEEMQKRVAAILEFIGRTQLDIANEQEERKQLLDERTNRYFELFSSQDTSDKFQGLVTAYKVSLETMEGLTRKLISWEQEFGRYNEEPLE